MKEARLAKKLSLKHTKVSWQINVSPSSNQSWGRCTVGRRECVSAIGLSLFGAPS